MFFWGHKVRKRCLKPTVTMGHLTLLTLGGTVNCVNHDREVVLVTVDDMRACPLPAGYENAQKQELAASDARYWRGAVPAAVWLTVTTSPPA